MKNQPLVTIITVVFNGEKYLEQTIKSVIAQTYSNIEYLIIDGGSTDGTLAILEKYQNNISKWISEPDKGLYDAMNKGIGMAKGELIGMINSDDWYEPKAVELVVNAAKGNPSKKIFHGDRFDVLEDGSKRTKPFHPSKLKFIYYGMTYNHPSMFVHCEIYRQMTYNTVLRALSDYEFVLKNFLRQPEIFQYIPHCYVNYRLDGLSSSLTYKQAIQEGFTTRKNAGLNLFENMISVLLRTIRVIISKIN